jgi:hypothetical protein
VAREHQQINRQHKSRQYFFEVRDEKTGRVLYSRGFASVYGEWETTDEANKLTRTFSESFRFPAPGRAGANSFEQARREE